MLRWIRSVVACGMAFINGLVHIGVAASGNVVTTPGAGLGYAPQPISFDISTPGMALNSINAVFGPVTGSGDAPWGNLTTVGIVDLAGNPFRTGTLASGNTTPRPGQLVVIPIGQLSITWP